MVAVCGTAPTARSFRSTCAPHRRAGQIAGLHAVAGRLIRALCTSVASSLTLYSCEAAEEEAVFRNMMQWNTAALGMR